MTKPFNIHDWQAKQRLTEAGMDTPGGNPDYFYDKDSIFGKLKDDPNFIKKVNAKNSKNNWEDPRDYNSKKDFLPKQEHHNDEDFPGKDLSAWDLLDKIKASNKDLYNKVEDFMKSMKENTTGTGASFSAGSGEGYMTPNAFKKKKK